MTGSLDYTVRLYDFNGMKADLRAFRSLEPCEGHPVLAVSWSPTGGQQGAHQTLLRHTVVKLLQP